MQDHHTAPRHAAAAAVPRLGGWQQADLPPADDAAAWLAGRLPDDWFVGAADVTVDREEIVVIGELAGAEAAPDADEAAERRGRAGPHRPLPRGDPRGSGCRSPTRPRPATAARSPGAPRIGETQVLFTHLAVPVMTRLRHDERRVLDTLVDAGVARSRSDALAWCVRLVGEHTDEWLTGLRDAMAEVDKLRAQGPAL